MGCKTNIFVQTNSSQMAKRIMILGALGQIGTELTEALRKMYGSDRVLATDIRNSEGSQKGRFVPLDACDKKALGELVDAFRPDEIYHLVAMLSANAEKAPIKGWDLNMASLIHVLELAREKKVGKVFWPSSIAAFGPSSSKDPCPQNTYMDPSTVYGISKLSGELWCRYYHDQYGVDVRSVRYPGLISWKGEPGGGTTDYAVEIFHEALRSNAYTSFIDRDTRLPMMYMPDALSATLKIMEVPAEKVKIRTAYNIGAISFTPGELAEAIRMERRDFQLSFAPDFRDAIARGWPAVMDDQAARMHWGHDPKFGLHEMVRDMLTNISAHS